jgi:hypothetical protein
MAGKKKTQSTTMMTKDYSYDTLDLNAPAIFLPSLSQFYVAQLDRLRQNPGIWTHRKSLPKGFDLSGEHLNYLKEDNGLFYYPYSLYSAGHANLNIESETLTETMVHKRNKNKTIILGDSGGYQIGKGLDKFKKFDWTHMDCESNNDIRLKVLRWLEHTADYSMTLDAPTWGIGSIKGINTFEECLEKNLSNYDFFVNNRVPGATKFLNIQHGRNIEECDRWWDAVKDYPFEGWAFGTIQTRDFYAILKRLLVMRDGGYLNDNQHWLHFLGVSRLTIGAALTLIQHNLRKHVNPNLTVSYDASGPFLSAAKGQMYVGYSCNKKKFGMEGVGVLDSKSLIGSDCKFPFVGSSISQHLTMGDLCVRVDPEVKTAWDIVSYAYIMNHNLEIMTQATFEASRLILLPSDAIAEIVPQELLEFKQICDEVFVCSNPMKLLDANRKLLSNLSGVNMFDKKLNLLQTSNPMFRFEDEKSTLEDIEDADLLIGESHLVD